MRLVALVISGHVASSSLDADARYVRIDDLPLRCLTRARRGARARSASTRLRPRAPLAPRRAIDRDASSPPSRAIPRARGVPDPAAPGEIEGPAARLAARLLQPPHEGRAREEDVGAFICDETRSFEHAEFCPEQPHRCHVELAAIDRVFAESRRATEAVQVLPLADADHHHARLRRRHTGCPRDDARPCPGGSTRGWRTVYKTSPSSVGWGRRRTWASREPASVEPRRTRSGASRGRSWRCPSSASGRRLSRFAPTGCSFAEGDRPDAGR